MKQVNSGGGPPGIQFAMTARQRGHPVTLYEKADKLGGQVNLVGAVPGKEEFLDAVLSRIGNLRLEVT